MSIISKSLDKIKTSPTLQMTQRARELRAAGKDIIGLSAGEPDFDTPENIKQAAIKAINTGQTKYTTVDGISSLKEAIQTKFKRENDLNYTLEQITVGAGAKQVLYNALVSTLNNLDEVIIPAPYWVSYPDMTLLAGGIPRIVSTSQNNNFKITPKELERAINKKTKWIILNSPSNPTGMCYSNDELLKLSEVLLNYPNVWVMTDDIYEHIIYDKKQFSTIASVENKLFNRTLTINGVSKAYAMTGWRIGYAGGPKDLIKAIAKVQSQSTSNPTSISQYAAIEALTGSQDFIKNTVNEFRVRRDFVVKKINQISGLSCEIPNGAFYIYVNCKDCIKKKTRGGKLINSDSDFISSLLEEANVAAVQGLAFGMEPYFRISYATSQHLLEKAMDRIEEFCNNLS